MKMSSKYLRILLAVGFLYGSFSHLSAVSASSVDTTQMEQELEQLMNTENKAELQLVQQALVRNLVVWAFKHQGSLHPGKVSKKLFGSLDAYMTWMELKENFTDFAWGDFFTGAILLPGAAEADHAISGLYNPWWDALLLVELRPNQEREPRIVELELTSGEMLRDDKSAGDGIETVFGLESHPVTNWMGLMSRSVKAFDDKYSETSCLAKYPLLNMKTDETALTQIQYRTVWRLAQLDLLLKNHGVREEMLGLVSLLRTATAEQFATLFPGEAAREYFALLEKLGPQFRQSITAYGYWGKEEERQYCFVCADNPRIVLMVYVHVGRGGDFEWFDLSESEKYLQLDNQED